MKNITVGRVDGRWIKFRDKSICKLKPHNGIRCKPSDDSFQRIREKLYLVRRLPQLRIDSVSQLTISCLHCATVPSRDLLGSQNEARCRAACRRENERKGKGREKGSVDILLIEWVHRVAQTTHVFHWLEDELIGKPFMRQNRAQRIVETNVCNNFSWFHC
jgi:hypothetical protein